MSAFQNIVSFELRYQWRSILFVSLVAAIAVIHFFSARKVGLDISLGASTDAATLAYNAGLAIIQNELVLSLLGVFPALALVATAITRDDEGATAELFYVQPIRPAAYVAGRFAGAVPFALIAALAGVAANFVSLTTPGIEPSLLGPTSLTPWFYVIAAVVLPNTLILSALIFAAAASVRSIAGAYSAALVLPLLALGALSLHAQGGGAWLAYADPFGLVAVTEVTRYWTRPELISRLPGGILWVNRLLWITIGAAVLTITVLRYRFTIAQGSIKPRIKLEMASTARPVGRVIAAPGFGPFSSLAQFASQLRMDLGAIFVSPVFYLIAALIVTACLGEANARAAAGFNLPQLPATSRLIPFLDVGIAMQLFFAIAYFSGLLVHRERAAHLDSIVDASPVATASPVLSKLVALFLMVGLLMGSGVATFVLYQLSTGGQVQPGLWLAGTAIYGFNQFIVIVPALFVHLLVRNRWLGTLLFVVALIVALSLPTVGFESLLASIRMPPTRYSDLNGFAPYLARDLAMMLYWTAIMAFVVVAACLTVPRGLQEGWRARLQSASSRLGGPALFAGGLSIATIVAAGGWIHFNTHVLNSYVTSEIAAGMAADYEQRYRRYANLPLPRPTRAEIALEMHPEERRLESSGRMVLVNDAASSIRDMLVTLNPALRATRLDIEGARLVERDDRLNVRRYRFERELPAGASTAVRWNLTWQDKGFANGIAPDTHLAANGTYFEARDAVPIIGYDRERELDQNPVRRKYMLPPVSRLPSVDDRSANVASGGGSRTPADIRILISTSADQIPVTSGRLQRQWTEGGRRYAEYVGRFPLPVAFASARYDVLHDRSANGIPVEVYFNPMHRSAISLIAKTATRGIAYYSEQFGAYPAELVPFRVVEYPTYWKSTHYEPGVVFYDEGAGFSLAYPLGAIDINLAHEIAHTWWDFQLHGAQVQGKEVLAEALPTYSALMLIEHVQGRAAVQPYLDYLRELYLDRVSREEIELQPVVRGESVLNSYLKGSLVLYTLRSAIGADAVNGALRKFLAEHANRQPNPTMRQLVSALRTSAAPQFQQLITDLFEKVTFYDVAIRKASVRKTAAGYEIILEVRAGKRYADGKGNEAEAPLLAPFQIAAFGPGNAVTSSTLMWLKTGAQRIVIRTSSLPKRVAVDPYGMMLDRRPDDNAVNL